jgi:hypothetical protein
MTKYIRMTKTYLVIITIFIVFRFSLELWGPEQVPNFYGGMDSTYITNEISVTRLLFVLPIFLGMRFAGGRGTWRMEDHDDRQFRVCLLGDGAG